jgi:hypothetical protein
MVVDIRLRDFVYSTNKCCELCLPDIKYDGALATAGRRHPLKAGAYLHVLHPVEVLGLNARFLGGKMVSGVTSCIASIVDRPSLDQVYKSR